jgi:hypothetical protein
MSSATKTPYLLGKERDNKIIELVKNATYISRSQVQKILFSDYEPAYAKRKCQDRLSVLSNPNKPFFKRDEAQSPYCYYSARNKPQHIHHYLSITDVLCCLLEQKQPHQQIEWKWKYQICNGMVIADAFFTVYLEPNRHKPIKVFLEVENDPSKRFDKDVQYERVFATDWNEPPQPEWVTIEKDPFNPSEVRTIFPTILIVTDKPVVINSPNNLRFRVASMSEIQKDIFGLIRK